VAGPERSVCVAVLKPHVQIPVAYAKALPRLAERARLHRGGILPFKQARLILSWLYRFSKEESTRFLKEMHEAGLIRIIPHRGIKICEKEVNKG